MKDPEAITVKERAKDFFAKVPFIEIVALLPLGVSFGAFDPRYIRLLYLLKILRIFRGFSSLEKTSFMKNIKMLYNKRQDYIIKNNIELAQNQHVDNNNIAAIISIAYIRRVFLLFLCILCFSYIFGLLWFIWCDLRLMEENENFIDVFNVMDSIE